MKLLVTGGYGFIGSNLAAEALIRGYDLIIFDNLSRLGSIENQYWLFTKGKHHFIHGDVRNQNDINNTIKETKPDIIFHLAGQVAMTSSIVDPRKDFEVNLIGSYNLLEAVREYCPETTIIYSSTNKVYGDLEQFTYTETATRYICNQYPNGFDEKISLDLHSPYGCSKGSADQYMLDYARIFGIKTVVFRHSSMYGGRQFSTYDQGWVGWFCQKAYEASVNANQQFTISGNGKQVRDVLHVDDIVTLYFNAASKINSIYGNAFNIGGGSESSLSLLELFNLLESFIKVPLIYSQIPTRQCDQKVFISDISKAKTMLDWYPKVNSHDGIIKMMHWVNCNK